MKRRRRPKGKDSVTHNRGVVPRNSWQSSAPAQTTGRYRQTAGLVPASKCPSGPGSNHVQITAAAAARMGSACHIVLYGHAPDPEPANLVLARRLGAQVTFTDDPDRSTVDAGLEEVAARLRAEGRSPYVVGRGGATPVGCLGYVDAAFELAEHGMDLIHPSGAPPFMLLGYKGQEKIIDEWQRKYKTLGYRVLDNMLQNLGAVGEVQKLEWYTIDQLVEAGLWEPQREWGRAAKKVSD